MPTLPETASPPATVLPSQLYPGRPATRGKWRVPSLPFSLRGARDGRPGLLRFTPIHRRPAAAMDGPDFHLCKASLILHPATYMQRLIFFLHFFGPDKTFRAIRR